MSKRGLVVVALLALIGVACGGGGGGDQGGLVGLVPGDGATTTSLSEGGNGSEETSPSEAGCEEPCELIVETREIPVGVNVTALLVGESGTMWVVSSDPGSLIELDLDTMSQIRTIDVAEGTVDIAQGEGALWLVVNEFGTGEMLRMDVETGEMVATIDPGVSGGPRSVTVGAGAVWTVLDGYGRVARIDPASNEALVIGLEGTQAGGAVETPIVFGHGLVWAVDASTGSVLRIDPTTNDVIDTIVDLGYKAVEGEDLTGILARGPMAMKAVPEGVWVLSEISSEEEGSNVLHGALFLLDAESGEVTRRIDVLGAPGYARPGLAVDEVAAWYVDRANGHLIRVDLDTEHRAFLRTPGFGALTTSVISLDGTIYFGTEGGFENPGALFAIDAEAAAAAGG